MVPVDSVFCNFVWVNREAEVIFIVVIFCEVKKDKSLLSESSPSHFSCGIWIFLHPHNLRLSRGGRKWKNSWGSCRNKGKPMKVKYFIFFPFFWQKSYNVSSPAASIAHSCHFFASFAFLILRIFPLYYFLWSRFPLSFPFPYSNLPDKNENGFDTCCVMM